MLFVKLNAPLQKRPPLSDKAPNPEFVISASWSSSVKGTALLNVEQTFLLHFAMISKQQHILGFAHGTGGGELYGSRCFADLSLRIDFMISETSIVNLIDWRELGLVGLSRTAVIAL